MARVFRLFLVLLLLGVTVVGCQSVRHGGNHPLPAPDPDGLRVASYNVHYILTRQSEGRWGIAGWQARKGPLTRAVAATRADIIAFQEMESFAGGDNDDNNLARAHLLAELPQYRAAAMGDWRVFPSTQPIFYRADRFDLLDQGWFFFSETPDVIYSRTFNGSYPAFASWARFRDRTGRAVRVVNLHTDFRSRENRERSIALVAERIRPWIAAGEAVIVAGDFNARAGSRLLAMLEAEGVTFAEVPGASYHLDRGLNLFAAIDHVGVAGPLRTGGAHVIRERFGDVWGSDHYPVVVDLGWR